MCGRRTNRLASPGIERAILNARSSWLEWITSPPGIVWGAILLGLGGVMAKSGLLDIWTTSEEYGHGLMVVAVLAYVVYSRWSNYRPTATGHAGLGIAMALFALLLLVLGEASGIHLMGYYGVWLFGLAVAWTAGGFSLSSRLLVPFLILPLLFPLPNPLGPMLTAELQLVSSRLGVWLIRLFGGTVYLEGNVIDMAGHKLLVAEACAGLRYLFPLMSLGAIAGYMMKAPLWIRWAAFLVTIPITILMNSLRIAVTGFLVQRWGLAHTEGFLHFFEGWVVFIAASIVLVGFLWCLVWLVPGRPGLVQVLAIAGPQGASPSPHAGGGYRPPLKALAAITALMFAAILGSGMLNGRGDTVPDRRELDDFPLRMGNWSGRTERLPTMTEEVAGASEYFFGDYTQEGGGPGVNAYIAYYKTQRAGRIPHSPKVCIPGGGWVIESQSSVRIPVPGGATQEVNRLVVALGTQRVVSYYWLKQGPRIYQQEMMARLDLVRFSLLEGRTDGALIRLTSAVRPGEAIEAADARLMAFTGEFTARVPAYVPD